MAFANLIWNAMTMVPLLSAMITPSVTLAATHADLPARLHQPLAGDEQSESLPLPVYWINLESSKDRRIYMEDMFSKLNATVGAAIHPVRLEATTRDDVAHLVATRRYIPNGVEIAQPSEGIPENKHLRQKYDPAEVAVTISHLRAISQAHSDGHEYALIVEDDAILSSNFLTGWRASAKLAPSDWDILQWRTCNDPFVAHASNLDNEAWVNWLPSYNCTTAYMVTRTGMENILQHSLFESLEGSTVWFIDEPKVVNPSEVIYYLAGRSYTSTIQWVGTTGSPDDVYNTKQQEVRTERLEARTPTRSERILVVTSCRLSDKAAISSEIHRLKMDAEILSQRHSTAQWIVNVVVPSEDLRNEFYATKSNLPSCIDTRIHVMSERFNKFSFFPSILKEFSRYDFVLMKDNDIRLAGFPWNKFMESKGEATVAGPLLETLDESLARNVGKPKRQYFKFFYGERWRQSEIAEYTSVSPIPVTFLEISFVLLKADFASWFFNQTLTPWYVSQPIDWGFNTMWCGAAKSFRPDTPSCVAVPVVALHEDTRQIDMSSQQMGQGQNVTKKLFEDPIFRSWVDAGASWEKIIRDGSEVDIIQERCMNETSLKDCNLTKCASLLVNGS